VLFWINQAGRRKKKETQRELALIVKELIMTVGPDYYFPKDQKRRRYEQTMPDWPPTSCSGEFVMETIQQKILPMMPNMLEIEVFGQAIIDDHRYYCDPLHGRKRAQQQNWALSTLRARFIPASYFVLFLYQNSQKMKSINGTVIDGAGKYFIVHSSLVPLSDEGDSPYPGDKNLNESTLAHADQQLVHRIPKSVRGYYDGQRRAANSTETPTPLFVGVDSIVGPCVAYPDPKVPIDENYRSVLVF
jgi:hypothetical protein